MDDGPPTAVARLLAGTEPLGTAFLLSGDHALTAFHCVGEVSTGSVTHAAPVLRFDHPVSAEIPTTVAECDRLLDVALLRLNSRLPGGLAPLRPGGAAIPHERFRAFGFPIASPEVGVHTVTGTVSGRTTRTVDGAPLLALYSQEAGARAALRLRGMSGGPVLAGTPERVIGVTRWQRSEPAEPDLASGGTFYATPMTAIPWTPVPPGTHRALLVGPPAEVRLLASVLGHREIGLYGEIREVTEGNEREIEAALRDLVTEAAPGDQLLVYLHGRAWGDRDGVARFAPRKTDNPLRALGGAEIAALVDQCPAASVLFVLDCADDAEALANALTGPGRAVLANAEPEGFTRAVADTILGQESGNGRRLLLDELVAALAQRAVPTVNLDHTTTPIAVARTWPSSAPLRVRLEPPSVEGRRTGEYEVVVDNLGSRAEEVSLAVSGRGVRARLERARLVVRPGARDRILLRLKAREQPGASRRVHSFALHARSSVWERSVPAVFAQRRRKVRMSPILWIGGLVALGAAALLFTLVPFGSGDEDRFDVSLGEVVGPGHPGPGAGELEEAASVDVYRFHLDPGHTAVRVAEPGCDGPMLDVALDDHQPALFGCETTLNAAPGDHELRVSSACGGIGMPGCTGTYRLQLSTTDGP